MSDLKRTIDQLGSFTHWNGNLIGEMSTYHIINTLKYIIEKADDYKMQYELYLIECPNWPLKTAVEDIEKLVSTDTQEWIKTTPIWKSLLEELSNRNMLEYAKIKVNIL